MKVLITGANGFIGSHLVERLVSIGEHTIYVLNRSHMQFKSNNVIEIIENLSSENFEEKLPENLDCIIHLAQSDQYRKFPEKADDVFEVNIRSTFRLLNFAQKKNVKKFIYFSSGNVYKPQDKFLIENDLLDSFSFYGSSKIISEELCKNYKNYFEICILRPFGIYGSGQKGMLIQNLHNKLINNEKIVLASGIGLNITPMYIDDCIEMVLEIILKPAIKEINTYNLCGNEVVNIKQISDCIAGKTNLKPVYVHDNDLPLNLKGDNSKICKALGHKPKINFEEGISMYLNNLKFIKTSN